jgi:hypothetical protein
MTVKLTDSASSAVANLATRFEVIPPGHNDNNKKPADMVGLKSYARAQAMAINGNKISCPASPIVIALGISITRLKSLMPRPRPMANIIIIRQKGSNSDGVMV